MSSYLDELIDCCRTAQDASVTERKKKTERIRNLLNKPSVVKALDHNSDAKAKDSRQGSKLFAWDHVFKAVRNLVLIEAEALQKAKVPQSATAQSNREKKKQEICGLFKFVIRLADRRGQRLKSADVIQHILNILQDPFTKEAFGADYSSVLLKDFLSVKKYWCDIKQETWSELLSLYTCILNDVPSSFDKVVVARIIHMLVRGTTSQCDLSAHRLMPFFTKFFKNVRQEQTQAVLEQMVSAMRVMAEAVAVDARAQICKLGESVFIALLHLWSTRPSEKLKDEMVEFLRLQVCAHHPRGRKTEEEGAYAQDWDLWRSHLRKLYEAIYDDLQQMGGRNRFATGGRECVLKQNYVELAADVCHQDTSVVEVTQMSFHETQPGGATKKRRVESGWDALREIVASSGNATQVIPWIQLLTVIVQRYPAAVPEQELCPLLSTIQQVQAECKKSDVTRWLLKCIGAFVRSHATIQDRISAATVEACRVIWQKIWTATLRIISLHHTMDEGFQVLRSLLEQKFVIPDRDIWTLFTPNICTCTDASLGFLTCYLRLHDLPENLQPSLLASSSLSEHRGKHALRFQLLDWLSPNKEDMAEAHSRSPVDIVDNGVLAEVLTALTLQDPSVLDVIPEVLPSDGDLRCLETVYLETSFDATVSENKQMAVCKKRTVPSCSQILVINSRLQTLVIKDSKYYQEVLEHNVETLEGMTCQCCLIARLLMCSVRFKLLEVEQVQQSPLFDPFKMLMRKLTSSMMEQIKKEGTKNLGGVITKLQNLFQWNGLEPQLAHAMADLCRSVTPGNLIEQLMNLAHDRGKQKSSSSHTQASSSRHGNGVDFDDFDIEFDEKPGTSMDDVSFDEFDNEESQAVELLAGSESAANRSLLSPEILTESQSQRLLCVQTLCMWCDHDGQPVFSYSSPALNTKYVKSKVLEMLDEEDYGWNHSKAFDLQLMKLIIEYLSMRTQHIGDEEMEDMLEVLRTVMKNHRRDQELSTAALVLLSQLVPHLGEKDAVVSQSKSDSREVALHLLAVFWRLSMDQNQYATSTRTEMMRCMQAFIEVDMHCEWAAWSAKMADTGSGDGKSCKLSEKFPFFLKDDNHGIRLEASKTIKILFVRHEGTADIPHSHHQQDQTFDRIYKLLQEDVLTVEGATSLQKLDEETNRAASVLHALATVATVSAVCEKKAVFAFCIIIKENNLDVNLVEKVLKQVSDKLGYPSLSVFLTTHLPYLIHHWLHTGYEVADFPYQLLGCHLQTEFYRQHSQVLIPHLVMHKKMQAVEGLGQALNTDWQDLLEDCIPKIIVHIIPLFAASKTDEMAQDHSVQARVKHASTCYDNVVKIVGQQTIEKAIVGHLDAIVVDILMTLYEPNVDQSEDTPFKRDSDPEPNPPHFNTYVITASLDYLTQCHTTSTNLKSLVALLSKSQDGIQKILLSLASCLSRAHRPHEKHRVVLMYRLFVRLLLKEFASSFGGSWAYVLREVIHTIIHNIQSVQLDNSYVSENYCSYEVGIVCMCCDLLCNVCEVTVEVCPEELGRFLPTITSALLPYVDKHREVQKRSMKLINFLVVSSATSLRKAITLLDPLPGHSEFQKARQLQERLKYQDGEFSLREELEHFLKVHENCTSAPESRLEGLHFLKNQLATQKHKLCGLLSECEKGQGDTLLVKMIQELIQLSKSANHQVALEAARCLGEIGPADLTVVTMKGCPYSPSLWLAVDRYSDDKAKQRNCVIFHLLNEYLVDPCVDTVVAASAVLKKLLATKSGVAFSQDYKDRVPEDPLFGYLFPYKSSRKKVASQPHNSQSGNAVSLIDDVNLWMPYGDAHDTWLTRLVIKLIESGAVQDELLRLLAPICKVKVKFCETVLPLLIHDILQQENETYRQMLSQQIGTFFANHCNMAQNAANRAATPFSLHEDTSVCYNKSSVRTMLGVVQYLRLQEKPAQGRNKATAWDNNFWLDLDYLQVAQAAQNCSAYFTTLMYSQIWCDTHRLASPLMSQSNSQSSHRSAAEGSQGIREDQDSMSQSSNLERLSGMTHPSNINVQNLMLQAYRCIGDPDGVYGCGAGRLADTEARIKTYEHENDWGKALGSYDLEMGQPGASTHMGLLQSLQNFGLSHVLDTYLQGLSQQADRCEDIHEFQYEAAWRLAAWNLDTPTRLDVECGYNQAIYSGLCAIKEQDLCRLPAFITLAREAVLQDVKQLSLESARSLYPALSRLQCITQMEDLADYMKRPGSLQLLLDKWQVQDEVAQNDFEFLEPVLSLRCILMNLLRTSARNHDQQHLVHQGALMQLQNLAKMARLAARHQVAERAIHKLGQLDTGSTEDLQWGWRIEEARLFWARGEQDTAKHLMKVLSDKLQQATKSNPEAAKLYPMCLGIHGSWLADTRSENPNVVMENYLIKAVDLLEELGEEDEVALDAFLSLARYADAQYQNMTSYMNSSTFEAKQALVKKAKEDAEKLRILGDKNSRYLRTLEKQSTIDERELETMVNDKHRFLLRAVQNYLKCLRSGDKHDLRIFRLTSLWFDNASHLNVNKEIKSGMKRIKSYKLLPLMYQLAARMSTQTIHCELFTPTLTQLIERTALDHPHHTLYIILALANANKDQQLIQGAGRTGRKSAGKLSLGAGSQESEPEEDRVLAAKEMVSRLQASNRADIIESMETLCVSYIQLANWNVDQYKKETRPIRLPDSLRITNMKNMVNVALPTAALKVDPDGKYEDIVYLREFQPTFSLAGGINLPKIISCFGSDGVWRKQLVKGKDDLRQDAVMQQVFGLVNNMLEKDPQTKKRKLKVRQYKVIPLSQRSGLLEWCEGTQPLGEYLIGANGAHQRYRPKDMKPHECRRELSEAHAGKSGKTKEEAFAHVCKHFHPVFRYFFLENFPDPANWYERRLAYTRSVATNSIVGYILGLGDRHVMNILIDKQTAELVHIDLGIAFEQGKILPTPETVPFRLTRDIVDGMGIAGVEGVFRRCCEKTMEVMHQSQEALLTILQVLLYDPLYAWTISPLKAYQLQHRPDKTEPDATELNATTTGDMLADIGNSPQSENQDNVNKMAERVLLRLQQKLQGVEDGVQLSVSGQVNHLIQEARDPKNLSKHYPGWQPYL